MATKATETKNASKKGISYGSKFGLDKERKKLGAETNEAKGLFNPGKDFLITRIVFTESKKRYDHEDKATGEIQRGLISIVQIDGVTAEGEAFKVYAGNAPIVEACEAIAKDADFRMDKEGFLGEPCIIHEVIAGQGEKNRNYLAFA